MIEGIAIPLLIYAELAALCALFILNRRELGMAFRSLKPKHWFGVAALAVSFFFLSASVPLSFPAVGDEFLYMSTAKNLALRGEYVSCSFDGFHDACWLPTKPHHVFPVVAGAVFALAGVSVEAAVDLNMVFGSLAVVAMFCASYLLFMDYGKALLSSLILALFPTNLVMAKSMETSTVSLFLVVLTLFLFLLWRRQQRGSLLCLAAVSLALAVQARVENALLVPLFLLFYFMFKQKPRWRSWSPWILLFALVSFQMIQVAALLAPGNITAYTTAEGTVFGTQKLLGNAAGIAYLIASEPYYIAVVVLLLAGLAKWTAGRKELLFLGAFFAVFFGLFLAFLRSDFVEVFNGLQATPYFGGYRFLFQAFAVLFIVAPAGCAVLASSVSKRARLSKQSAFWLLFAAFVVASVPSIWDVYVTGNPYTTSVSSYEDFMSVKGAIPDGCYVLSDASGMISSLTAFKVMDIRSAVEDPKRFSSIVESHCVVYYEGPRTRLTMVPLKPKEALAAFNFTVMKNVSVASGSFYTSVELVTLKVDDASSTG